MTDFSREYGEGLYDLAREEQLQDEMLNQLNVLREVFHNEPDFLKLLSNRAIGISERLEIIDAALKAQVMPYVLNFIKILCQRDALGEFEGCVKVFEKEFNEDSSIAVAQVTTVTPLSDDQKARLIEKLKTMTGRRVVLREKTDPSIMGGVILEMDGQRWDNTVKQRLSEIKGIISGRT